MKSWAIGIDIGGTFTDVVAANHETGSMHSTKVLTTHQDPTLGVIGGAKKILEEFSIDPSSVGKVVHATTLFTNALIERRGCSTGLLVNEGFKDVLEIGHERKYDLYDLNIEKAAALVERRLRGEISARMLADGTVKQAVDAEEVIEQTRRLVDAGIESLAICLLHSYVNPAHEQEIRDIVTRAFPQLSITLSSEIAPVVREYERISTTVANAYIKPLASRYLHELQRRMQELGIGVDVLMMLSNGGLTHIHEAAEHPIELLESGPAAGAIAAAHLSMRDGEDSLLAFDMGGTTAKLCLVENGQPSIAHHFEAARQKRFAEGSGLPLHLTTIDLIEIGAGGGSIAHIDPLGLLKVGPQSAGSEPGPACYDRGGDDATVTDANLVLGYLNPDYFAGGTLEIDTSLSVDALGDVGKEVDRPIQSVAWGIHDIVAENMAGAARVHVAERGRDPHDFVLLCTGGGGPLHSYYVAQKIGIRKIICPPSAGVASAYGLLVAPARADRSRTVKIRPATDGLAAIESVFRELEGAAAKPLHALDAAFGPIALHRYADGRFVGQGFNLTVRLPDGPYDNEKEDEAVIRARLIEAFESGYRQKFGRTPPDIPIELINLRVTAEAPPRQPLRHDTLSSSNHPAPKAHRRVYFVEAGKEIETPIYERADIPTGFKAPGPVLIEDAGSTLVVGPKGSVEQLASGNLIITIEE